MEMNLSGVTALVTGSTKGIGKAIAFELAREGVNVIVNGRGKADVLAVVTEISQQFPTTKPEAAVYDLTQENQLLGLLKEFPKVDLLINNLGIFQPTDYYQIKDEDWLRFFKTNVLISNTLSKHYLPVMLEENFGRIIFIASEEALMPSGEMAHYSMTKTMQLSLAKTLARETKGSLVTVNTILPGPTLTEGVTTMLADLYPNQELSFSGSVIRADGGMVPTIF